MDKDSREEQSGEYILFLITTPQNRTINLPNLSLLYLQASLSNSISKNIKKSLYALVGGLGVAIG